MDRRLQPSATRDAWRAPADSSLAPGESLAEFDFTAVRAVSGAHVMALAKTDSWTRQGHDLPSLGPPGTDKTHFVVGIGRLLDPREGIAAATFYD